MHHRSRKVVQAWLETPTGGTIELFKDWTTSETPDLQLSGGLPFSKLGRLGDHLFAKKYGYFIGARDQIFFVLFISDHQELDTAIERLYLTGDFNGWQAAIGMAKWELNAASFGGEQAFVWSGPAQPFLSSGGFRFKFATNTQRWLLAANDAPNIVRDEKNNLNQFFDPERTGRHLFRFEVAAPLDLSKSYAVEWSKAPGENAPLRPDGYFFRLKSDLELGALVRRNETTFRLFAPRASKVDVFLSPSLDEQNKAHSYPLRRRFEPLEGTRESLTLSVAAPRVEKGRISVPQDWQGVWEVTLDQNLHGWYYWYRVEGPSDPFSLFLPNQKVLDPYAQACVGRQGPGIVLERDYVGKGESSFKTPAWQNLVIAEVHVRDLIRKAPLELSPAERLSFAGLKKWVESPDCYLHRLGVNCVELQPIQENDSLSKDEYHWGYMPVNWFAPASTYATNPADGSVVHEFRSLVHAFHHRGMAVVLDVVFNHQGVPSNLMFIDKQYYFETDGGGHLSNWSGCGNDLRASAAMAKRLIVDSCVHMIRAFGVDGFRFDLAELLGIEVLRDIERSLKQVKPDVILIAEPWSFRGHIAGELAETGWSSWNDGYRNFMRDFVRGGGGAAQLEYFLKGSPWYFARWPAQTVNYTESHDDRTWIDTITENGDGSGLHPSALDRRRTHLMAACLFSSLGIPMIAAGQDFLRSKHGVNNTYLRGDLNALDYRRAFGFSGTHAYFGEWIAFRLSERGRLLRQWSCPSDGFFRSFTRGDQPALALLYNADCSQGPSRLLFAINASNSDLSIPVDAEIAALPWVQLADQERFRAKGLRGMCMPVGAPLEMPALSCALWAC